MKARHVVVAVNGTLVSTFSAVMLQSLLDMIGDYPITITLRGQSTLPRQPSEIVPEALALAPFCSQMTSHSDSAGALLLKHLCFITFGLLDVLTRVLLRFRFERLGSTVLQSSWLIPSTGDMLQWGT